jgi:hypothetical protein
VNFDSTAVMKLFIILYRLKFLLGAMEGTTVKDTDFSKLGHGK